MTKRTKNIADALRKAIAQAQRQGASRYAMSKASGVSQGMLSQFVNGKGELRLSTASRIAQSIGYELTLTKCR